MIRTTLLGRFIALETVTYPDKKTGEIKRFDTLHILDIDDEGQVRKEEPVKAIRVPQEARTVAEKLAADCELGTVVELSVVARSFAQGNRGVMSFSLEYGEIADAA